MSSGRALALALGALLTAACGGVSYRLHADVAVPSTVAVLPFAGDSPSGLRDSARQLLHSRLRNIGYQVPELGWIDRVLTEHGWLRDPERFDPSGLPLDRIANALAVDAVMLGKDLDESSFNIVVLRRHAVSGSLIVRTAAGREFWSSDHGASTFGGFLLTSGQVFTELRAQGEHGTPMASLALVDEWIADVVGTLPKPPMVDTMQAALAVSDVATRRERHADGSERLVVEARANAGSTVRFEAWPNVIGVPMAHHPDQPDRFRGEYDLAAGSPLDRIVVRARDAFGREATAEAVR